MQIAAELDVSQVMLHRATLSCFFYENSGENDMKTSACVKYQVGDMLSFPVIFAIAF